MEFLKDYVSDDVIEDIISNNKDIVINDLVYNQDNVIKVLNYLQELGIENINDILVEKIDFFFRDIDLVKEHFNRYDKDVIVKLINEDISNFLIAGVPDEVVNNNKYFMEYSEKLLDLKPGKYFNSGVLLMNLNEFRKDRIEEKFLHILNKYNFDVVAPDQDYLNFLCKGKVKYLNRGWDRMPNPDESFNDTDLHLIHFNMFQKPWNYNNVLYQEYFWKYASSTDFFDEIRAMKNKYTLEDIKRDKKGEENLINQSRKIAKSDFTFKNIIDKDYFNFL